MSRVTAWITVLGLILMTGVAAYELAYIEHLTMLLNVLLQGSPN